MTSIESYVRDVSSHPVLTDEQELELARRYAETKDQAARAKIVAANLQLVVQVARKYTRTRSVMADLIQEGNLGLFEALDGFDYKRGYKFSTYAVYFVRGKMVQFLLENSPHLQDDKEDAQDQVGESSTEQRPDILVEQAQTDHVKARIKELLSYFEQTLSPRELEIFRSLWRSEQRSPLQELSRRYGLTAPRIHQIEREILGRLKSFIGERMGHALAC